MTNVERELRAKNWNRVPNVGDADMAAKIRIGDVQAKLLAGKRVIYRQTNIPREPWITDMFLIRNIFVRNKIYCRNLES